MFGPFVRSRTSTPRSAAAARRSTKACPGAKKAVVSHSRSLAPAISALYRWRATVPPAFGELRVTWRSTPSSKLAGFG